MGDRVAWVTVEREEQEEQRFWLSVIGELRSAIEEDGFVDRLEPAPMFDGDAVVARLIAELGSLERPVVLVIDDLHELRSPDALRQLELLLAQRPASLRIVLASRRDPRLGLHRLRLTGELAEIRSADLRFTLDEARELLADAGLALSEENVARLHERTEGWAAGLRLAALALSGHPDPERFVGEFTGSERNVADYLFTEVLERQPEDARRLLLRTSILERVNGALGDLLTGSAGSQRVLQELEEENAFVVSLDASRQWFRYHRLFADLLRLELERAEPEVVPELHRIAAGWYEAQGDFVSAVQHAQAAQDWATAARLLAEHGFGLALDGHGGTMQRLLRVFPSAYVAADPELARLFAGGEVWVGSLAEAERYVALAERSASKVPEDRRVRFEVMLGLTRLFLARRRGDYTAALEEAQPLLAVEAPAAAEAGLDDDVLANALMHLGTTEVWSGRMAEAERHLERAVELARRGRRPYIEVDSLSHLAVAVARRSLSLARERGLEAVAVAEANGWGADRVAGTAFVALANVDLWQGRFDDAEHWLERAEQTVRPELEPATAPLLLVARGRLQVARGQYEDAVVAFRAAAELESQLVEPQLMTVPARRMLAQTQVQLGDTAAARATLAELPEQERESDMARAALAYAHLTEGDPQAAVDELAPVLDGSVPSRSLLLVQAHLLDAIAHDRLGDTQTAEADVERALELAEPDGLIWPFLATPSGELLERHPPHRSAHGALLKDILAALAGSAPSARAGDLPALRENLTESELRVLRYLPSNLSTPEIAGELYLSFHTVKTHLRHIYAKLGVHRRTEAVERARELGLLAPSSRLR